MRSNRVERLQECRGRSQSRATVKKNGLSLGHFYKISSVEPWSPVSHAHDFGHTIHISSYYSIPLGSIGHHIFLCYRLTTIRVHHSKSALPKASCLASAFTNSWHSSRLRGTSSRISRMVLAAPRPNKKANGMLLLPPDAEIIADDTNGLNVDY